MYTLTRKKKELLRRWAAMLLVTSLLIPTASVASTVSAQDATGSIETASEKAPTTAKIWVNGTPYTGKSFLHNSTTYVGIREFSMFMGADSVDWNGDTKTAVVKSDELTLKAKSGSTYVEAAGRYFWCRYGVIIREGTMYLPIRVLAKAFGSEVIWHQNTKTVEMNGQGKLIPSDSYYNQNDLAWLSKIIQAESGSEPLLGKIAVGTVVLNRVKSSLFPNTIYGVIFDTNNGVQFTPIANGAIHNTPSAESIIAAKLCLEGASISSSALFFINSKIAQSTWVSDNRPFLMTIGNHDFFA